MGGGETVVVEYVLNVLPLMLAGSATAKPHTYVRWRRGSSKNALPNKYKCSYKSNFHLSAHQTASLSES